MTRGEALTYSVAPLMMMADRPRKDTMAFIPAPNDTPERLTERIELLRAELERLPPHERRWTDQRALELMMVHRSYLERKRLAGTKAPPEGQAGQAGPGTDADPSHQAHDR